MLARPNSWVEFQHLDSKGVVMFVRRQSSIALHVIQQEFYTQAGALGHKQWPAVCTASSYRKAAHSIATVQKKGELQAYKKMESADPRGSPRALTRS